MFTLEVGPHLFYVLVFLSFACTVNAVGYTLRAFSRDEPQALD